MGGCNNTYLRYPSTAWRWLRSLGLMVSVAHSSQPNADSGSLSCASPNLWICPQWEYTVHWQCNLSATSLFHVADPAGPSWPLGSLLQTIASSQCWVRHSKALTTPEFPSPWSLFWRRLQCPLDVEQCMFPSKANRHGTGLLEIGKSKNGYECLVIRTNVLTSHFDCILAPISATDIFTGWLPPFI